MENQMFCYQCQETAKGTGCTRVGVCGKQVTTSSKIDLLLFVVRGVSVASTTLRENQLMVPEDVNAYVTDALFSTITNANFDDSAFLAKIQEGFAVRERLLDMAELHDVEVPNVDEIVWYGGIGAYEAKSVLVGVKRTENEDVRSLKELVVYGVKGMAAYVEHARHLGYLEPKLDAFIQRALSDITIKRMSIEELVGLVLETGEHGIQAMALLDKANTSTFGHPRSTVVPTGVGKRPGILVSGHDLYDLQMLLQQSSGSGVDIYTHGEMLPAHYYPLLKQYSHLIGNYGSSWWRQREDFATFNGPIVLTTNCLVPPMEEANYRNRIFTTNAVGFPGCIHISSDHRGRKDFSEVIAMAKKCAPPKELENGALLGGYAHKQVTEVLDKIVKAVKDGQIRKFIVMAGCDGRMRSREYYTEFASRLPHDCVVLTAGCAKYRYNKLTMGFAGDIPRLLDAGQCNDCYSLVLIALALRDAFALKDVNELPLVFNIAWYEQKAVIVLLALLSLNIKNIHLGPTLPAFLSPHVLNVLKQNFALDTITTVDEDLKKMVA